MANKALFNRAGRGPVADTTNNAGGKAYSMAPKHALAQMVATGCLNGTFYTKSEDQLKNILSLVTEVEPEFVAKVAVYGRKKAFMKDTPALLVAWLSCNGHNKLASEIFTQVIDNGKMLRNYVQIMRSGRLGRKSLGNGKIQPKGLIRAWLRERSDEYLFYASVGKNPSLADIVKMVHPKPHSKEREAFYGYLLGKKYSKKNLSKTIKDYEKFKTSGGKVAPKVNFQMLTSLSLEDSHWEKIAKDAKWMMTRMNLNTFQRHGVFKKENMVKMIADRLKDRDQIVKSRCFPYQLLSAYLNINSDMPYDIKESIQDAMEIAVDNIPQYTTKNGKPAKIWIFPDVSGSMRQSITGGYESSRSVIQCLHVAALTSACIQRRNPSAGIIPFACRLFNDSINLNGRDSIMTNTQRLTGLPGGGTDCALPLAYLNDKKESGDLVIYISDNESWVERSRYWSHSSTSAQHEWERFKKRNPKAKMINIDIVPNTSTQVKERNDVLNIGGFSDVVFDVIGDFVKHGKDNKHWVDVIEG